MSKTSVVVREEKRKILIQKYLKRRTALKEQVRSYEASPEERWAASFKLQKLPRDSSRARLTLRCALTGRPRGVYRKFGVSRIKIRELAAFGYIPGLRKASW